MGDTNNEIVDFLCTVFVFSVTALCMPFLFVSYVGVQIVHRLWTAAISLRHRNVEVIKNTTFRTLVDTHRNQGIIAVLLIVKGPIDEISVRRHLQELVNRKDKQGKLAFPRLKQGLSTKWGSYVWQKVDFEMDNQLLMGPNTFKGRVITELNIQECVSDIMSKFLAVGTPPWQVVLIPSLESQHYIFVRLHHVLLNDGLNIADILPLIPPVRSVSEMEVIKSPLMEVFQKPVNFQYLEDRLMEEFANRWNEFISNYDPLEQTDLLKNTPGIFKYMAICIITLASTFRECKKGLPMTRNDILSKVKFIKQTLAKEAWKRKVSFPTFLTSIIHTLNPINIVKFIVAYWWYALKNILKIPLYVYHEIRALISCFTMRYVTYPNTFFGNFYNYVPLFFYAFQEVLYVARVVIYTPIIVLRELLTGYNTIQTVTLCGRKVVSWSRPVKTSFIRNLAQVTGTSETEILLSAMSESLSRYISESNEKLPECIPITARGINSNYILATGKNVKPVDSIGGMLCINLPILGAGKRKNVTENLTRIRSNFSRAREEQPLVYLLSMMQTKFGIFSKILPATIVSIALKYLSKRYSVAFTELTSKHPNIREKTLWGQEVSSIIYWRPPQANISISISVNQYADYMVFGVMCDAQLVPHHPALSKGFVEHLQELARAVGVAET